MEVIKRYNNRKLYSTEIKKYVNMGYIVDLVKMGHLGKFIVINNTTKEDVTAATLKQAILTINPTKESLATFIKYN